MNTPAAELHRPAAGVLHFHAAQRWIGLLGGLAFLGVIVLGVWGLRQWEEAARSRKAANSESAKVATENSANLLPPVPTFVTAGLINSDDPEPKAQEEPKPEDQKPPAAGETPRTYPLPKKPAPRGLQGGRSNQRQPDAGEPVAQLPNVMILRRVLAPRDAIVKSIQVQDGQLVKKGDLLMMLTSETVEWQLIELRGQLESAEAKLALLDQKRASLQRLIQQNAASQEELAELQAEVQLAQAELKTGKGQYDIVARAQQGLNILAPVEGKIHAPYLEANLLGNPVHRGEMLLEIVAADGEDRTNNR
jgi:biotin carboxyl carrier protein